MFPPYSSSSVSFLPEGRTSPLRGMSASGSTSGIVPVIDALRGPFIFAPDSVLLTSSLSNTGEGMVVLVTTPLLSSLMTSSLTAACSGSGDTVGAGISGSFFGCSFSITLSRPGITPASWAIMSAVCSFVLSSICCLRCCSPFFFLASQSFMKSERSIWPGTWSSTGVSSGCAETVSGCAAGCEGAAVTVSGSAGAGRGVFTAAVAPGS